MRTLKMNIFSTMLILLISSCSSSNKDFSGKWVSDEYAGTYLEIEKHSKAYTVHYEMGGGLYDDFTGKADGNILIDNRGHEAIIYSKAENKLLYDGQKFSKGSNKVKKETVSKKNKMIGLWKAEEIEVNSDVVDIACSVLNFDLKISINSDDNSLTIVGGSIYSDKFNIKDEVEFKNLDYSDKVLKGSYIYKWNPGGGPALLVDNYYKSSYTFYESFEVKNVDSKTIIVTLLDNKFDCDPMILKKQ